MRVDILQPAEEALAWIMRDNESVGYAILVRINKLGAEPFPHEFGIVKVNSESVIELRKQEYDVRKLSCTEFRKYRIFYFVDEAAQWVVVCEIIRRDADTYSDTAPHIIRIKEAYKQHPWQSMN